MSPFSLEGVEPYSPGLTQRLPSGNHVCKVVTAQDDETKTRKPMISLRLGNGTGEARDWLVLSDAEFSRAKVVGFFAALGMEPSDEWLTDQGHIKQSVLDTTLGKEVGVIIRDEADDRPEHSGETQPRVKGYASAAAVREANGATPAVTSGQSSGNGMATKTDDDIPF